MDAKDFFINLISTDANCPVDVFADKYSRDDLIRFAEAWHSAKMQEVTDEGRKCLGCGTPLGDYCEQCQHLLES